jgi:hypothetical protein
MPAQEPILGAGVQSSLPCEECQTCRPWNDPERFSLQIMEGLYFKSGIGPNAQGFRQPQGAGGATVFNYAITNLRLGYRPSIASEGEEAWTDHIQFLLDLNVAEVVEGFGHEFVGPSALLRYNLSDGTTLVPYVQLGAGIINTDAYKEQRQHLIGEAAEFLLLAEAGLRWKMSDAWSLDLEGGFQHISNADMATRNAGVNCFGGSVGVTFSFGAHADCKGE